MAFPALLDACVLYPAYLCDTLLRLAEAEAYRPLWSSDILTELRRNVVEAGIPEDRVDRRIAHMTRSFPDAMITGYESLIDGMVDDPKDRHVLAAAVRASADVIVTFNIRDFPEPALKPYDIVATHPDDFLLDQLDLYPGLTIDVLEQQAASYRREPTTSQACCPCSNARAYPSSPPRSAGTFAETRRSRATGRHRLGPFVTAKVFVCRNLRVHFRAFAQ